MATARDRHYYTRWVSQARWESKTLSGGEGERFFAVAMSLFPTSRGLLNHPGEEGREYSTMLIAMAGLPGTGKSTLARQMARALSGVVLDKDVIRAALFPPALVEY